MQNKTQMVYDNVVYVADLYYAHCFLVIYLFFGSGCSISISYSEFRLLFDYIRLLYTYILCYNHIVSMSLED